MWEREMKGLVITRDYRLTLKTDIPEPQIGEYQALTKTIACGLCNGTDLKLIKGAVRGISGYPAVLGHEAVGQVIRVGDKVRNFKVGDYVLRSANLPTEKYNTLWGGFAEYGMAEDYTAMKEDRDPGADIESSTRQVIPKSIDPVEGTMIITLKEVCSALKRMGMQDGMNVLITGDGPVGLSMVRLCRLKHANKIIHAGHYDNRLETSRKLGADIALNTKTTDLEKAVRDLCPDGIDLSIDCVGSADVFNQGLRLIRPDGILAVYGIGIKSGSDVRWEDGPYNYTVRSVQWPIAKEESAVHEEVVKYVTEGNIELSDFVTHQLPVEDFEEGLRLVTSREGLKVALTF